MNPLGDVFFSPQFTIPILASVNAASGHKLQYSKPDTLSMVSILYTTKKNHALINNTPFVKYTIGQLTKP